MSHYEAEIARLMTEIRHLRRLVDRLREERDDAAELAAAGACNGDDMGRAMIRQFARNDAKEQEMG